MSDPEKQKKQIRLGGWLTGLAVGFLLGVWVCSSCTTGGGILQCALPWANEVGL